MSVCLTESGSIRAMAGGGVSGAPAAAAADIGRVVLNILRGALA